MNLFKDIFDTAVDVVAAPVRLGAALVDEVFEDEAATETVNRITEKVKGE